MSISDEDIKREDILKLVRKSASTNQNSESIDKSEDYLEHRAKFLEYRKQFEQPPPPVDKKPFFPYWVKPEYNTDVSITYKKRGSQISDVKINYLDGEKANDREENLLESSNEKTRQPGKFMRSVEASQSLKIIEEKINMELVFKTADVMTDNREEKVSITNPVPNSTNDYSIAQKPIMCRPIVRKVIELKKYNHILEDVIINSRNQ